jgi:hypothetical protein
MRVLSERLGAPNCAGNWRDRAGAGTRDTAGCHLGDRRPRSAQLEIRARSLSEAEPDASAPGVAYQIAHLSRPLLDTLPQGAPR